MNLKERFVKLKNHRPTKPDPTIVREGITGQAMGLLLAGLGLGTLLGAPKYGAVASWTLIALGVLLFALLRATTRDALIRLLEKPEAVA